MPSRILVVESETYSSSKLKSLLSEYQKAIEFIFVENRKEASEILKRISFEKVVTALKIPRLSDGYVFIAQMAEKYFQSENIIVVVDEKTDNVLTSLHSRGVAHIYSATELGNVVKAIVNSAGSSSAVNKNVETITVHENFDLDKIKTVLNYVMGPVGNMIFKDVARRWQDHDDLNELLNLIKDEINDPEKIKQFSDNLN